MYILKLLLVFLAVSGILCVFPHSVIASNDEADESDGGGAFSFFGDLFRSNDSDDSDNEPAPKPVRQRPSSGSYEPVLTFSLSETFLNSVVKKYVSPDMILTDIYFGFDTNKDGLVIRGKVKLPEEMMAEYGLPEAVGELGFQSALTLKITKKGYLAIVFSDSLTSVWPGSADSPSNSQKVAIPTGFLEMAIGRARVQLATMSGDLTSMKRRKAVFEASLKAERERMATLGGSERAMAELNIEALTLEQSLIDVKIKRAKQLAKSDNKIVQFVGDAEFRSSLNLKAQRNTILINPNLDKMFPLLSEVRMGKIDFTRYNNSRYMDITLDALVRK